MSDNNDIIHVPGENLPQGNDNSFDAEALISQFLSGTQYLSAATKDRYSKSLRVYFNWVKESGLILKNIQSPDLIRYVHELQETNSQRTGDKLSNYTIGAYIAAVKEFYAWASGIGLLFNPALSLKAPKRDSKFERKPLNEDQIKKLLDWFKARSKRDYAIASTLYYCGLRTIELVRLDYGDIRLIDDVRVIYVQGKGKSEKNRWVKLLDVAVTPILEYLKTRPDISEKDPIFVSESITEAGGRLIPGTISKIMRKGLNAIGLKDRNYTAHSIRHSSATNALRKGATLDQVAEMLRHENSSTTKIYGKMALEEKRLKEIGAEDFLAKNNDKK